MTTTRGMLQRGLVIGSTLVMLAGACGDETPARDDATPSTTVRETGPSAPVGEEDRDAPTLDLARVVSDAADGATIQLEEADYSLDTELIIERSVAVLGAEGGTTILVDLGVADLPDLVAIRSRSDDVRLEGLELTAMPGAMNDEATLLAIERGRFEIEGLTVQGARMGIRVDSDASGTIRASRFEGSSFGVSVAASAVAIEDNTMLDHQVGLVFDGTSQATARGNLITESSNGMLVQSEAAPLIVDNELRGNAEAGVAFYEGGGATATGNSLVDNRWGFDVRSAAPTHLSGNELEDNAIAIYYWVNGGTGDVQDNRCTANQRDIVLAGPIAPTIGNNRCETVVAP